MRRMVPVLFIVCLSASLMGVVAPISGAATSVDPVTVAAAGDIACAPPGNWTMTKCHQFETSNLLTDADAVLPLGDEQYNCGQLSAFRSVYDSSWGRYNFKSHPVVGDNEYAGQGCTTPGASGYFTYFGDRATPQQLGCRVNCKGYYSYDLGGWHIVALNSECDQPNVGGCSATSPQVKWLKADLAADTSACTLAYVHRPYFGDKGNRLYRLKPLAEALYNDGAELLLSGHAHIYERFAPQTPTGSRDDLRGITQFIVGTGGKSQTALASTPPPNAEVRNTGTYGVLKLTLSAGSYSYQFVQDPTSSKSFTESGIGTCH
jgi:hypothetical protein